MGIRVRAYATPTTAVSVTSTHSASSDAWRSDGTHRRIPRRPGRG
ncbi:hypothetical protein [Streptomyces sp. NPDC008317]